MKRKAIIALILVASLLLSGCDAVIEQDTVLGAHGDETEEPAQLSMTSVSILYYPDMDVNPVTTTCYSNSEALKLVYSPLIRLNSAFEPVCVIADSYLRENDVITVKLRDDAVFSNGARVTATDVVKSFDVARKNPTSPYYKSVSSFKRYYATDDKTFVCMLSDAMVDGVGLLDIPVMYNGVVGSGCGPYELTKSEGSPVLVPMQSYFSQPSIPLIKLTELKSDTLVTAMFSAGGLDIISNAGSDDLSLTSQRDYSIVKYPSNNLIYIGVSFRNELLARADVRHALSVCIDRAGIANRTLVGLADATVYPFNPNWYRMTRNSVDSCPVYTDAQVAEALELLKQIPLNMLVPSESDIKTAVANAIVEQLKALGVTLTVTPLLPDVYEQTVKSGSFDLYLGETAVSRDMDPTFLYATTGGMNYGGCADSELDLLFGSYKRGDTGLTGYLSAFSEALPVIPVVFRKNVIYCANGITSFSEQTAWNSFGDITTAVLR